MQKNISLFVSAFKFNLLVVRRKVYTVSEILYPCQIFGGMVSVSVPIQRILFPQDKYKEATKNYLLINYIQLNQTTNLRK